MKTVEFNANAGAHLNPKGKECDGRIFTILIKGSGGVYDDLVECRKCHRELGAFADRLVNPQPPPNPAKESGGRFEVYASTTTNGRFSIFITGQPAGEVFRDKDGKWSPGSARDRKFDTWEQAAEAEQHFE